MYVEINNAEEIIKSNVLVDKIEKEINTLEY